MAAWSTTSVYSLPPLEDHLNSARTGSIVQFLDCVRTAPTHAVQTEQGNSKALLLLGQGI